MGQRMVSLAVLAVMAWMVLAAVVVASVAGVPGFIAEVEHRPAPRHAVLGPR